MMDRRLFLFSLAAFGACKELPSHAVPKSHQKIMAITMDDFNLGFDIGLSRKARNGNILSAFEAINHKAAGFVTGDFVKSEWGEKVVKTWIDKGHLIANHTWSHPHASDMRSSDFLADVEYNQAYLDGVEGTSKYFRFPYLDDGPNRERQMELFAGLSEMDLRNAPVTIDSVDWYTTSRLEAALKENVETELEAYREYYVEMCVALSNHWDRIALDLGFVSLPHLTLMHHNILNGYFLNDVLLALQSDGWQFIDAAKALEFQPYHPIPHEPTRGRNWLTLKGLENGVRTTEFPKQYREFGRKTMDARGL